MNTDLATSDYWDKAWSHTKLPRTMHPTKNPVDRRFQDFFRKYLPTNSRVLEVGCAASNWLPFFGQGMGCELWGADYSRAGLALTQKNLGMFGLTAQLLEGDFVTLPIEKNSIDIVFTKGVIEHYKDPTPLFQKTIEVLKPGGVVLTMIPNFRGIWGSLLKWVNHPVYDVHVPFAPEELDKFQKAVGLEPVVKGRPFGVYYAGVVDWKEKTKNLSPLANRVIDYAAQTVDRVVGWGTYPFGGLFDNNLTSPYFVSVYRKPK